jgi:adenylosuccinate lyase
MQDEPTSLRIPDPGVRALFTEPARFQSWLDVEAALARAQAELGIIPEAAAREIVAKAQLPFLDMDAVRAGLAKTGHPLVPLVWALDKACAGDAGGYVHWGATTQNVTQTGQLLQARRAHEIFLAQLAALLTTLATWPSAARTCSCPAAPTASTPSPPRSGSRSRCGSTSWAVTWSASSAARAACSW